MIGVVLADDQALVRAGFRALLDAQPDIEVVGEAGDGDQAFSLTMELRPDVVLMDIRMPGRDGLEATRMIAGDDRLADVRIVILTTFELDEYVFEAIRAGASGFLVKDTEPVELLRAVRAVAAGDALLSPGVTRHARASAVTVRLGYGDGVTVEVVDDGVGGPAGPGNGIAGMRERAAALGGTVEAGARPGEGFGVVAHRPGGPGDGDGAR